MTEESTEPQKRTRRTYTRRTKPAESVAAVDTSPAAESSAAVETGPTTESGAAVEAGRATQSSTASDVNGTSEDRASMTRSVVAEKRPPLEDFRDLGRDMFLTGLVSSHTGSLSVRRDEKMWVSRRGAMLGRLTETDLIEVAIGGEVPEDAAEEAIVHQAVYRSTDAQSVIYARPPSTMALALVEDRLSPASRDGADNLGSAPVLISQRNLDSPDIAQLIGRTLRESRVAALRGQGVFARGSDLFDAFHMVSLLEEMCKVAQIYRTIAREEAQPAGFEQRQPNQFRPRNDNYGRRPPGGRPPQRGPSGPPRQGGGGPPGRPPFQPRDPNGARRGPPPPRH